MSNEILIKKFQDSITESLDKQNYFAALLTSLTLPDIWAKIEFPNEQSVNIRYKEWLEKYFVHVIDMSVSFNKYLTSQNKYALRYAIVHEGTSNPTYSKKDINHQYLVDEIIPFLNHNDIDPLYVSFTKSKYYDEIKTSFFIDIHFFCDLIIKAVDEFLEDPSCFSKETINLFSIAYTGYQGSSLAFIKF